MINRAQCVCGVYNPERAVLRIIKGAGDGHPIYMHSKVQIVIVAQEEHQRGWRESYSADRTLGIEWHQKRSARGFSLCPSYHG